GWLLSGRLFTRRFLRRGLFGRRFLPGVHAGLAREDLIKRLLQRAGDRDPLSVADEHALEQRELGAAGRPYIDRLHVEQPTAYGECQQVSTFDLGLASPGEQVEVLGDRRISIEVVLHLPWAWD